MMLFHKFILCLKSYAFLIILFLFINSKSNAQYSHYIPDSSFAQNGKLITTIPGQFVRSLVLPDSTMLLGGYGNVNGKTRFITVRLNGNGSFNSLWGNGGVVVDSFPNTDQNQINDMIYLPTERVLIMGRADSFSTFNIGLSKHLMNGNLDSSFGVNGMVILPHSNNLSTSSMALQSNGKIVLAGNYAGHIMVCRLHANGKIDSTFGTNGISYVTIGTLPYDGGASIKVLQDDRIVVGGHTYHSTQSWAAVLRFLPNGSVDSSFGTNGHVENNVSGYGDYINNIVIQNDGKILASGYNVQQNSPIKILIIRYDSTGNLDLSFAGNGIKQKNINNYDDKSFNTIIQPDGNIVLGGYTTNFTTNTFTDFLLYGIDSLGNDDNDFAPGGIISGNYFLNQSNYNDKGQTMCSLTNGKLLVAGNTYLSGSGTMSAMMWKPSVITQPTGIDYEDLESGRFEFYPNPANEILYLRFPETKIESTIVVENIIGQQMISQTILPHSKNEVLNIAHFNQGVYLIKWIKKNGSADIVKWIKN